MKVGNVPRETQVTTKECQVRSEMTGKTCKQDISIVYDLMFSLRVTIVVTGE